VPRARLFAVGLGIALVAAAPVRGLVPAAAETPAASGEASTIDEGPAPANPFDPSLAGSPLPDGGPTYFAKLVERLRPDGSSGFLPFRTPTDSFGAYRMQLVSSDEGDVEVVRSAVATAAAELTQLTGITFTVDPGQTPRPTSVSRFPPGWCGTATGYRCSLFADGDASLGVIRVTISGGSPCGALVSAGSRQGTVGCGGPESATGSDGIHHLRGNVWLSPSLADANATNALAVVAHEIAHAMGLDHFQPAFTAVAGAGPVRQLMFPALHGDASDTGGVYRSGDANGLRWLQPSDAWYIAATYRDFLGRAPDTAGYQYWARSTIGRAAYVDALAGSDEWVGRIVADFYGDVFGRPPDAAGGAHWADLVRTRGVPFVAAQLYGSAEYLARNGGTAVGFVQGLYRELLRRDPTADPRGVAFWVAEAQRRGRGEVAFGFFQSDENRRGRVRGLYCTLLERPPDAAGETYWAAAVLAQGDLALARNLATSAEYVERADDFVLAASGGASGCA
jgi:hypothetical protein